MFRFLKLGLKNEILENSGMSTNELKMSSINLKKITALFYKF